MPFPSPKRRQCPFSTPPREVREAPRSSSEDAQGSGRVQCARECLRGRKEGVLCGRGARTRQRIRQNQTVAPLRSAWNRGGVQRSAARTRFAWASTREFRAKLRVQALRYDFSCVHCLARMGCLDCQDYDGCYRRSASTQ